MTSPTAKFVSYLRVSTQKQGNSGLGLEAQRSAVESYVTQSKGVHLNEFVEVESGRKSDRLELSRALTMCRVHAATLIVAKLDRLSRNAHFLLGLKEAGVDFVCTDMPQANRMSVGLMAIVAEEEARLISARTKSALQEAKRRGVRLGHPNLTATARDKGQRAASKNRRLRASSRARDLAPIIEDIQAQGTTTLSAIAHELSRRGVPTTLGGQWTPTQVRRIINRNQLR